MTGRYVYCPMAGKNRRNRMSLRERFLRWRKMRSRKIDVFPICDYGPACYPSGYKK